MAGRVSDVAGNLNTISMSLDNSITYDTASLLASINQSVTETIGACSFVAAVDPSNSTGFAYKILFSKNINPTTFTIGDIANAGTSGAVTWSLTSCGDNRTFKLVADTIAHNGTVIPEIGAGNVEDSLGNPNALSTGADSSVTYDSVAPSVTINQGIAETVGSCSFSATADPTNATGFSYKVVFSENIQAASFIAGDIVNNGTSGLVAWNLESCGNNQVFKLTASTIFSAGTVVPVINAGSVSDLAGNTNTLSTATDNSVTYDTNVPTVTINQAIAQTVGSCSFSATVDPSNVAGFSYRITFSKAINASTFVSGDLTNGGTGGATALTWLLENCGDDQNFKLTANSITGQGTIIPSLPAGRISDVAGNSNTLSTSTDNSVTYDSVAPTVTINQAVAETVGSCSFSATTDPANTSGFSYRVIFSEAINASTFDVSDVTNSGTGGSTTLNWSLSNCGDNRNFKLTASSISGIGTIIPEIPSASVSDLAGNTNSASTSTDNTVTFDNVVPSVTINQSTTETVGSCSFNSTTDPTSLTGFSYKVVFSEAINEPSFATGDIVNNGTTGVVVWNLEHCENSQVFKLTATSIIMDGTVIPVVSASSVSDLAGNTNTLSTSTDNSVTYDSTKPSLTINQATAQTIGSCTFTTTPDPASAAGFSYHVAFSEAIESTSFTTADVSNTGTGGSTTLTWLLENCGDNQNFKLTASSITGDGTIIPRVVADQVYDLAGNQNTLSTATDNTVTFDTGKPSVTINQAIAQSVGTCSFSATTDPTNAAGFSYRITFSEAINASTFDTSDIANSGTGGATSLTWALSGCGDNQNFKLTASSITGNGTIIPNVSAGGVSDVAGNTNTLSTSADNSVTYDTTGPSIVISRAVLETVGSCSFTATGATEYSTGFSYKVAFSEKINTSTFAIGDVTNTGTGGATTLTWSLTNCGDDQNYKLTVSAIVGEGTVIPQIADSALTDVAGNQNTLSTLNNGTVTYELAGWKQEAYIKAVNSGASDQFGKVISLSSDTLAVGVEAEDSNATTITNGTGFSGTDSGATDSGAAYIYKRTGANWEQEAYIKATNAGTQDIFGTSISIDGDTLAVGARYEDSNATTITNGTGVSGTDSSSDSGAVYVYKRTGTAWAQEAYIKAVNNGGSDYFGASVSLSGNTLAVGAYGEDSNATTITNGTGVSGVDFASSSGAVYVYKRTGTAWAQEAYVKAANSGISDLFGMNVSLNGDTLVVGAYNEDSNATTITNGTNASTDDLSTDSGAAYVYRRSGVNWQQEAYLKAANTGDGDLYGVALSISGDTLAVGARFEDSNATIITNGTGVSAGVETATNSGAVYVYRRTGVTWQQEAYIKASNAGSSDYFGNSVSLSGETLAVGAYLEDSNATTIINGTGTTGAESSSNSGAVYIYKRTGTTWQQEAYVKASNNGASDQFGINISLSGDTLAVGANLEDSNATTITNGTSTSGTDVGATDSGAVYVYRNNARLFDIQEVYLSSATTSSLTLAWRAIGLKTVGYRIAYAVGLNAPVNCNAGTVVDVGNVTSYNFTSLDPGTHYSFRICSYDSLANETEGFTISFPTLTSVPEPGDLSYVVNSDRAVTFSWAAAGGSATGYKIAYQLGATPPTSCNSGTVVDVGNVLTYQVTSFLTNSFYGVRVCAYNASSVLSMGKYVTVKTLLALDPTNLYTTSTATSNNALVVNWTNASDRVTGFIVAWQAGSTAPASCSLGTVVDAGNVTNYSITGLSAGATYSARICAYESGGVHTSTGATIAGNVRANGWVQEAYIKAVNSGVSDNYAYHLHLNGTTLAVSSNLEDSNATTITNGTGFSGTDSGATDTGAVYVYKRSGTTWQQEAYIKAVNAGVSDYFGSSISINGDTLAVGTRYEDSNATTITNGPGVSGTDSANESGAVYVYKRTGVNWQQEAYIKAVNNGTNDAFGNHISINGNTLAVGAFYEDSNATTITNGTGVSGIDTGAGDSGAVYVYKRTGTAWAQEAYIKASNNGISDNFGSFISLNGDTLAVGTSFEDSNATTITNGTATTGTDPSASYDSGAVYVYRRTGTTWQQEAYIKAVNGGTGDYFGSVISLSGDTLAVGARMEDSNATTITNGAGFSGVDTGANDSGAVYVYKRSGTAWAQEAYIKASNAGAVDYFGQALSLSGDTLAVGAWAEDSNATTITNGTGTTGGDFSANSGAVYVYKRTGTAWQQEAFIKAVNNDASDAFGFNLALSGDTIAVGVYSEDSNSSTITNGTSASADNSSSNSGAVYVYRNNARLFDIQSVYLSATTTSGFTLNWEAVGQRTTGYKIAYAVGLNAPVSCSTGTVVDVGNVTSYNFTSLDPGTHYSFRICSYDSLANETEGFTISFPTLTSVPEPGDLSYVVNSDRAVTFSWAAAGGSATGYKIAYQVGATPPTSCNSGTVVDVGNVLTYQVTGLLTNSFYGVRVCAYNASSVLSIGKYVTVKTLLALNPTNLYTTSTATSNNALVVNWTNASDRVTGFIVAWQAGDVAPTTCANGTVVDAGNVTNYSITGLSAGATYSARICAYESGVTHTSTGTTIAGNVRANGWVQEAYIKAVNNGATDYFGYYLALHGDTLAVSAYFEDSNATTITNGTGYSGTDSGADNSGAVYVYKRAGTTWQQEAYIKAVNAGISDYFGSSISLNRDTLAVGTQNEDSNATTITNGTGFSETNTLTDSGAVYIYKRTGATWEQEAYIKASNTGSGDYFGTSVAISGDTLAVGAQNEDSNATTITNGTGFSGTDIGAMDSGAVYVYKRTGTTWAQEAYIKASNNGASDNFGYSVDLSANTLAVGAYREDSNAMTITNGTGTSGTDTGANDSGAVYVYRRTGTTWAQEAYIKASNAGASDYFGTNISLSGETLVVGVYREDSNATTITNGTGVSAGAETGTDSGATYVYKRTGTAWQQEAYIKSINSEYNDQFGYDVSLSGETLAVSAFFEDSNQTVITNGTGASSNNDFSNSGAVYIYKRTGTAWQQEAYIKAINRGSSDVFGTSISLSGDTLAVGAYGEDSNATTITNGTSTGGADLGASDSSGAVYVYRNNARLFDITEVYATITSNSIQLKWMKTGGTSTGYAVNYVAGTGTPTACSVAIDNDLGNNSEFLANSLTADTDYTFRICVYDGSSNFIESKIVTVRTAL